MTDLFDIWLPVFKLGIEMSNTPDVFADYEDSRQRCLFEIDEAIQAGSQHDSAEEEKEAALFAVIAWFDERVLCSELPWRQRWLAELLQRKYLNTTVAGTDFYTRLTALKATHHQARKVFLFSLQNEFHGQYGTGNMHAEREAIIDEQRELCLPSDWYSQPAEAAVTPCRENQIAVKPLRRRLLPGLFALAILLYVIVFLFFYQQII